MPRKRKSNLSKYSSRARAAKIKRSKESTARADFRREEQAKRQSALREESTSQRQERQNIIMGKRSKKPRDNPMISDSKVIEEIDTIVDQDTASNDENPQKSKKRKNQTEVTENKKKKTKNAVVTEEVQEEKTVKKEDKSKNKNKRKQNNPTKNQSNKKIIFEENTGEPIEVATSSSKEVNKKQNTDLEQVKDEEIDAFCDELTEEDNVQYESWIQQIEAKLKSNKVSSKT